MYFNLITVVPRLAPSINGKTLSSENIPRLIRGTKELVNTDDD